ncbi:MAG TPA: 2-hydroxyacid dehydrogenase [Burkholderiales bacterium]|nr:2-hydroxyacid dehydrogenase [Burkholderiales bacterium]
MKPEILVLVPIYAPTLATLEREFTVHKLWTARDPDTLVNEVSGNVRAVVTTGSSGMAASLFHALPRLEIVGCFGTPHGAVDLDLARRRGVIVTNTPDSITGDVADLALGLMVAVMRRIAEADRFVRAGKWLSELLTPGTGLGGKTCGIIGLGAIGRGIAKRAEAFRMTVCYHGPRPKEGVSYSYYPDLAELARASDCLVVACLSTPETRNLVDARILAALGPEGYLVNIARGPIVDEQALIAALRDRRIAGAALDVFWDEPRVPAELMTMENVVLAPHIGSTTQEVREGRGAKLLANLRAHFAGQPVPTPLA